MDSRQLSYFRQIVDHGSFTLAAAEIHMTQPALSLVVRRLEKELGMRLLDRGRQGVRTTEAGRYLYATAVHVLDQIDSAALHIRSLADGLAGRVLLSSTPIFNWGHLPNILVALRDHAPDVDLVLEDPPPDQTMRDVLDGVADIGLVTVWSVEQLQAMYGDRLEIRLVTELELVAVLPPEWGNVGHTVTLTELRDARWIMPSTSTTFPGLPELLDHLWNVNPELRPRRIQRTSGIQTALPLVAANLGVTVVPDTVRRLADRSISIRTFGHSVPSLQAAVVWKRDDDKSPATRKVIDLILDSSKWNRATNL
jgi:DNA-binding transcriptional LysR family regulator